MPGSPAHGRVVDDTTGRPVAGARVEVRECDAMPKGGGWQVRAITRTGADGRFDVEALSLRAPTPNEEPLLVVEIDAPGYEWTHERDRAETFHLPDLGTFEISPAIDVPGTLTHEDGTPVAGGTVAMWLARGGMGVERSDDKHGDVTDANGRFTLPRIVVGARYEVTATTADRGEEIKEVRILAPVGVVAPHVDLRFGGTASIVLDVRDPAGQAMHDADVRAWLDGGHVTATLTDPPVITGVAAGRHTLCAFVHGWYTWRGDVDLHTGRNDDVVAVADALLSGTIVDDSGAAVPEADVSLFVPGIDEPLSGGRIGANGTFRIHGLAPGRYVVGVAKDGCYGGPFEVTAPSGDVTLRLTRVGRALVRLRCVAGTTLPHDAWISRQAGPGTSLWPSVEKDALRIVCSDAGPQDLIVHVDGFDDFRLTFDAKPGVEVDLGMRDLVARPQAHDDEEIAVPLVVLGPDGKRMLGTRVTVGNDWPERFSLPDDGNGVIRADAPGPKLVRVRTGGLAGFGVCDVRGGAQPFVVRLQPTRRVHFVVDDSRDGELGASSILILRAGIAAEWERIELDARERGVSELLPGRWHAVLDDNRSATDFDVPDAPTPADPPLVVHLPLR